MATQTLIKKTDSMTQIQTKLKNKGLIKFEKGIYKITRQLILDKDTTVDLNGSTLKRCASIQSIFLNRVSKGNTGYSAAGNITIKNGIVEGMGGYSYDNLITMFHAKNIYFGQVTFKDALCHAIELNACSDVTITNCNFLGCNLQKTDYAYREQIQIDHAGAGSFFLSSSSKTSACYDKTPCANITISNCFFGKSEYRDYPYACIGNHTQMYQGVQHSNINIINNEFHCKHSSLEQPCLSIISMRDVTIQYNRFDCDKVARIYSKTESYKTNGSKVSYYEGDGVCNNVFIANNMISCSQDSAFKQSSKTGKKHKNITKTSNTYNVKM